MTALNSKETSEDRKLQLTDDVAHFNLIKLFQEMATDSCKWAVNRIHKALVVESSSDMAYMAAKVP
jgi:hypothetical protein